jgi:hypothetical protein
MKVILILFPIVVPFFLGAQKQYQPPVFEKFRPLTANSSYINTSNQSNNQDISTSHAAYSMGGSADKIIAQQNARAMQQMGYNQGQIPPSDPSRAHEFIKNQYAKVFRQQAKLNEVLNDLNEVIASEHEQKAEYFLSDKFKKESNSYWKAKTLLTDMLNGKTNLSLKDAFYILESAYGNTHLSYSEYSAVLKKSGDFIKDWLKENGHSASDIRALHFGIQSFMRDTLTISKMVQRACWSF